jgi:hypothetical protein
MVMAATLAVAACAGASSPGQPSAAAFGVTLAPSSLSCHPHPNVPCAAYVEAVVTNPSGRALSYAWSGCGSGTAYNTTCRIDRPDQETVVTVDVTDAIGLTARASATVTGQNLAPELTILDFVLWESQVSFEVSGIISDPEHPSGSHCGTVSLRAVSASGICENGYYRCIVGNLDVGANKTAPSGACDLTLSAADEWGLSASTTKSFSLPRK